MKAQRPGRNCEILWLGSVKNEHSSVPRCDRRKEGEWAEGNALRLIYLASSQSQHEAFFPNTTNEAAGHPSQNG